MARFFLLAAGLITASVIQAACSADTSNANTNTNANLASPLAAATPTPGTGRGDYTEKQATEERERAKESKETIGDIAKGRIDRSSQDIFIGAITGVRSQYLAG